MTRNESEIPDETREYSHTEINARKFPESCEVVEALPEFFCDLPGIYDVEILLSDDAPAGEETICLVNSS